MGWRDSVDDVEGVADGIDEGEIMLDGVDTVVYLENELAAIVMVPSILKVFP